MFSWLSFLDRAPFVIHSIKMAEGTRSSTPRPDTLILTSCTGGQCFSPIVGSKPETPVLSVPQKKKLNFSKDIDESMPNLANLTISDTSPERYFQFPQFQSSEEDKILDNLMADLYLAQMKVNKLINDPRLFSRMAEYNDVLDKRNMGINTGLLNFEVILQDREDLQKFKQFLDEKHSEPQNLVSLGETANSFKNIQENKKNLALAQKTENDFDLSLNKKEKKELRRQERKKKRKEKASFRKCFGGNFIDSCTCKCQCQISLANAHQKLLDYIKCVKIE